MTQPMTEEQYIELTKSIKLLQTDVNKLHGRFGEIDSKVTSISNFVSGDPHIIGSTGAHKEIELLRQKVQRNERELVRVQRLDLIEDKVDSHEKRLDTIWTVYFTIAVIASIIGGLAGIFIPSLF